MAMIGCLIGLFLVAYTDQYSPYLNILDVILVSSAGLFVLFVIIILIAFWRHG